MIFRTLSGRFFLLSFIFVMIAEILIFIPSIAKFRIDSMQQRLELAQLASLALLATPDDMVAPALSDELLSNAEVLTISLHRDEVRELVLAKPIPKPISKVFDLRDVGIFESIYDSIVCAFGESGHIIKVVGQPVKDAGIRIEIVLDDTPIKQEMLEYGRNVLLLSLLISTMTGILLFMALQVMISRPIFRVISSMMKFRQNPEDANNVISPSSTIVELRQAETALQDMQLQLNASLRQKERLAALGEAVSKISHDLRNMLTTTQILADRLEMSDDPAVVKTTPKLLGSLSRAINLCERTLTFGKAEEPKPEMRETSLKAIVEDVIAGEQVADDQNGIEIISMVPHEIKINADPEQMFRALSNLIRNARQAIGISQDSGMITVQAASLEEGTEILVRDNGPGLPPKAQEFLFQPFQGGASSKGTGLGLAIAAELIKGHGGKLELVETSQQGTTFRIFLPTRTK